MENVNIITLEQGWDQEIYPKGIKKLELILIGGVNSGGDKKQKLFSNQDYMHIYTLCYNMCVQRDPYNWSEELYHKHEETIKNYLLQHVLPKLEQVHDVFLLKSLRHHWNQHLLMNKWMNRFFIYLNRHYIDHHSLPTLAQAGMQLFKDMVYEVIKGKVINAMIIVINNEREGSMIDRQLIRDIVRMFEVMGMNSLDAYRNDFECKYLEGTKLYYLNKAECWIEQDSTPEYLVKAEKALKVEGHRVEHYLHSSTEPKVLQVMEKEVLEDRQKVLLEKEHSGCMCLLQNDKSEDLSRMFRLFQRTPNGLAAMAAYVKQHIEKLGQSVVEKRQAMISNDAKADTANDPGFVKELLTLHEKYHHVVNHDFKGHAVFQKALEEAFVEFVNRSVGKYTNAEVMSTFCDRLLKTGGEKASEEQVENYLEKVVHLFSYLTDKDLFAEIYRNQMAKRLLNQRSASDDAERLFIGKLKLRCGAQFTSKMEGMLNDLTLAVDQQTQFSAYLSQEASTFTQFEFSVQVLTTGHWPTYQRYSVTLPTQFEQCTHVFKEFYDSKTSHRRLQWVHSLGNATLRGHFAKNYYDLQVTTLQAIALLLFNDDQDTLSFTVIREALNLSEDVVKRIMHSLSCGIFKVLTKVPPSKTISTSDSFQFSSTFSSPKRKLRIPMASLEATHNPKRVEEDRSIAIEAAIVRIMKSRKTLGHQQLVSEVLSQLSFFQPNLRVIKRRIEALIDREYLERDVDQTNSYKYLA